MSTAKSQKSESNPKAKKIGRPRKKKSIDFLNNIIQKLESSDKTIREIADEYGISYTLAYDLTKEALDYDMDRYDTYLQRPSPNRGMKYKKSNSPKSYCGPVETETKNETKTEREVVQAELSADVSEQLSESNSNVCDFDFSVIKSNINTPSVSQTFDEFVGKQNSSSTENLSSETSESSKASDFNFDSLDSAISHFEEVINSTKTLLQSLDK